MSDLSGRKVFKVFNQDFIVDDRYTVTKELGQGAYGIVCAATNTQTGEGVAIKKVTNVFSKKILAKRALREIKLLQHFRGHRNLMECDLAAIIRSGQPLTDAHFQSFIYQILCGLKYIHSANVLHRDLKPGNLLVNADCELKICDFGLARGFSQDPEENAGYMTEYVATRWYRAPEIMLSFQSYTKAIDVWSVGCILAELLGGRPFFKGRDYVDQLNQILHYLGTPNEETLSRIGSPRAQEYVRNLPYMPKVPFTRLFPQANPDALDLLDRMLAFDPSSRISVEDALEHRYLHIWHDASDEPACPKTFDFAFEVVDDVQDMRKMILDEVMRFRQHVRQTPGAQSASPVINVPIPQNPSHYKAEEPRPQEAGTFAGNDLEHELQAGELVTSVQTEVKQSLKYAIHILLRLPPNFELLEQRVLEIATPSQPSYGKHLRREQVQALQGPGTEVIDAVLETLSTLDVPENSIKYKGHWFTLEINVTVAEQLLNTQFHYFSNLHGQQIIRTLEYSVPQSIHQFVEMIQPTTYFGRLYPQSSKVLKTSTATSLVNISSSYDPVACNLTVTPVCLRGLYGLGNDTSVIGPSAPFNGNILGMSGFLEEYARSNDLKHFAEIFAQYISNDAAQDSVEGALDIQYAMALAPSVPISYYSTAGHGPLVPEVDQPSLVGGTNEPYLEELQYLLSLDDIDLPRVLSTSYGEDEQSLPRSYAIEVCRLFLALGGRGVSVIFSSGDSGPGSSCESNDGKNKTLYLPMFPASCPYVTSVGGTKGVGPERAAHFSSGGFSNVFARPSYQNDAVSEYLDCHGNATNSSLFTSGERAFPDVAAQASNFFVVDKGLLKRVSGTSAAAPVFAAIIANLNAIRVSFGLSPMGFLNPFLYGQGRVGLTDIPIGGSTGCQGFSDISGLSGKFVAYAGWNATVGWDPVTGLGTPNFPKLAEASLGKLGVDHVEKGSEYIAGVNV
ncbi:hypothetical protein DV737_g786, partial [Chaetothyriales sp. CBS 132003]